MWTGPVPRLISSLGRKSPRSRALRRRSVLSLTPPLVACRSAFPSTGAAVVLTMSGPPDRELTSQKARKLPSIFTTGTQTGTKATTGTTGATGGQAKIVACHRLRMARWNNGRPRSQGRKSPDSNRKVQLAAALFLQYPGSTEGFTNRLCVALVRLAREAWMD